MTDKPPAGPAAPKRTPAPKTSSAPKIPAATTPVATTPLVKAAAVVMAPAATTPAARKTTATRAATTVPAVEPVPTPAAAPAAAAMAPAAWYPVAAGSPQQRWWDGARWTEHVYDPGMAAARAAVVPATPSAASTPALRAPDGVRPGTVWFWLLAGGAPVLTLLDLIPTSIYLSQVIGGDTADPTSVAASVFTPAYLLVALSGWFIYAVCIVFGLLDWRELKARGVPKPFHWAWSFVVIAVGWPAVYVIGRTVVARRRTGSGMAPLWVFIGLQVVTFIVTLVVVITAFVQFAGDLLSASGNAL